MVTFSTPRSLGRHLYAGLSPYLKVATLYFSINSLARGKAGNGRVTPEVAKEGGMGITLVVVTFTTPCSLGIHLYAVLGHRPPTDTLYFNMKSLARGQAGNGRVT